ncbi:DUF1656 domain-containing protein [Diaphorobacter ruginosibacter]|uniref:DUF1656 domain-containing protein n=1 Tax=Diaphorobacter ruginosibacter TaxID=1715720 RepID=UPI003340E60C
MIGEASFYGLYLPWLLPLALLALLVLMGVQRMLAAMGLYRRIWHPALFDIALYVVVLWCLTRLSALLQ